MRDQNIEQIPIEGWHGAETKTAVRKFNAIVNEMTALKKEAAQARRELAAAADDPPSWSRLQELKKTVEKNEYQGLLKELTARLHFAAELKDRLADDVKHEAAKRRTRRRDALNRQTQALLDAGFSGGRELAQLEATRVPAVAALHAQCESLREASRRDFGSPRAIQKVKEQIAAVATP